jgi:hypothetical protein
MQRTPMKQAIRENRRGKVRVAEYVLLQDDSPEVALLRSRMEICDQIHAVIVPAVWFIGYAPEFDPLELGAPAPEYDALFKRHDALLELMFRRRTGEDRRIQEFKDAGDEWLRRLIRYALSGQG